MENAGRGAAASLRNRLSGNEHVLIICGSGNNGGDGAVVARHLDSWGISVEVVWLTDPNQLTGDAQIQQKILKASKILQNWTQTTSKLLHLISSANWLVDGILGTGLSRPIEGILSEMIDAINQSNCSVLALDLPSGLDADTGLPLGTSIRAEFTTTFVAKKQGFIYPHALEYTGQIEVIEIGIPRDLLAQFM
jgi:NAD(P)H-hydrate epimerase